MNQILMLFDYSTISGPDLLARCEKLAFMHKTDVFNPQTQDLHKMCESFQIQAKIIYYENDLMGAIYKFKCLPCSFC